MITQQERTSSPPARDAERRLQARLEQFDVWANTADKRDSDWESDFPKWRELTQEAEKLMAQEHPSEHTLLLLGRCWSITNEGEDCAFWAREHIQEPHVQELVRSLTESVHSDTRWQAYDVFRDLHPLDARTQALLELGTKDGDPYVRRRASLALFQHPDIDHADYVRRMLNDADSYNRYVGVKEAKLLGAKALQDQVQAALQDPAVAEWYEYYLDHKHSIDQFENR